MAGRPGGQAKNRLFAALVTAVAVGVLVLYWGDTRPEADTIKALGFGVLFVGVLMLVTSLFGGRR